MFEYDWICVEVYRLGLLEIGLYEKMFLGGFLKSLILNSLELGLSF